LRTTVITKSPSPLPSPEGRGGKIAIAVLAAMAAVTLAALLDRSVAVSLEKSGLPDWLRSHKTLAELIKLPGESYFIAIVALIVAIAHPRRWRAGAFVLLAMLVSGINAVIKWMIGRIRPFKLPMYDSADNPLVLPFDFEPFTDGIVGLTQARNLCFPSGHAALSFATATALAILWPRARWRWLAYAWAALVSAERVAENAHWLSDVVAGAALGIGVVDLIHGVVGRLMLTTDEAKPTDS
jgi:membrane-associated phospholipid phosphatase